MTKQLCKVKTAEGIRLCQIVRDFIYDYKSLFPSVEVRAIDGKPLNPINRIIVSMNRVELVPQS